MIDFVYFLGRFHVLILHLPIGILLLTVVLDFMSRSQRHAYLAQALPLCWAATAITAILTVVLGMMHFSEGGFDGPSASAHRNYGISVAVMSLAIWFIAAKLPALYQQVRLFSNFLLLFLITMTGHYGGNLTHGSTFLVEYAPQPIRAMAGLEERRPPVTDLAQADPWHDIVRPMLQARCSTCHNNDKQNGQLNLATMESLLAGSESGAVVVPGNADSSELYLRITLPENHEDFMPAEGKTPLTEQQTAIIRWWIESGLPSDTALVAEELGEDMTELLAMELGLEAPETGVSYPEVSSDIIEQMVSLGWLVRPLSQESNGLVVSVYSPGQAITRDMLDAVSQASASIIDLDLASGGLHDELLASLSAMPALESLNLSNNGLTDAALQMLAGFPELRVMNLYGNPEITDEGMKSLAAMENLQTLYVWGTAVTPDGMAALPAVTVHGQAQVSDTVNN